MKSITKFIGVEPPPDRVILNLYREEPQEPFETSEHINQSLVNLIPDEGEFEVMYHLDKFFASLLRKQVEGYIFNQGFTRYCAKSQHRLDKYFSGHFERLWEKWVISPE